MSVTAAQIGKGVLLSYADAAGGTNWASLGELLEVKPPKSSIEKVEATNSESPDNTKEFLSSGWIENDDLEAKLNYLKAQTTTLYGLLGVSKDYKVTLPDSSTFVFTGFLSGLGHATPIKDVITQDITVTPKHKNTFTAGS